MSRLETLLLAVAFAGVAVTAVAQESSNNASDDPSASAELSEETREAWAAFKDYGYEQKEEALAAGAQAVDAIDAKIDELEARAEAAGDEAARDWEQRKAQLQERRDALAEDLGELREASADTYQNAKEEVVERYDATTDELADAWADLTK